MSVCVSVCECVFARANQGKKKDDRRVIVFLSLSLKSKNCQSFTKPPRRTRLVYIKNGSESRSVIYKYILIKSENTYESGQQNCETLAQTGNKIDGYRNAIV